MTTLHVFQAAGAARRGAWLAALHCAPRAWARRLKAMAAWPVVSAALCARPQVGQRTTLHASVKCLRSRQCSCRLPKWGKHPPFHHQMDRTVPDHIRLLPTAPKVELTRRHLARAISAGGGGEVVVGWAAPACAASHESNLWYSRHTARLAARPALRPRRTLQVIVPKVPRKFLF